MSDRVIGQVFRGRFDPGPSVPVIMHDDDTLQPIDMHAIMDTECQLRTCVEPPEITAARATLPDTPCADHFAEVRRG